MANSSDELQEYKAEVEDVEMFSSLLEHFDNKQYFSVSPLCQWHAVRFVTGEAYS